MEIVALCIGGSILASVITTKILATHYFEIVDGYVRDVVDKAKKTMKEFVLEQGRFCRDESDGETLYVSQYLDQEEKIVVVKEMKSDCAREG